MTLFDLLILLLVAGICGALGPAITGYSWAGHLAVFSRRLYRRVANH